MRSGLPGAARSARHGGEGGRPMHGKALDPDRRCVAVPRRRLRGLHVGSRPGGGEPKARQTRRAANLGLPVEVEMARAQQVDRVASRDGRRRRRDRRREMPMLVPELVRQPEEQVKARREDLEPAVRRLQHRCGPAFGTVPRSKDQSERPPPQRRPGSSRRRRRGMVARTADRRPRRQQAPHCRVSP